MTTEEFQTEADERALWGEPPEKVLRFLHAQNVETREAIRIVEKAQQKRNACLRGLGARRILIGLLLMSVPCIAYAIFSYLGAVPTRLFGVSVLVGLIGFWKLIDGAWMAFFPEKEKGEISSKFS